MRPEHIGVAGEYRVMSELLLRGFNPSRSAIDLCVDMILDNFIKIQVKAVSRPYNGWYTAQLGNRKYTQKKLADVYIIWCIEDDCFYIIPKNIVTGNSTFAVPSPKRVKVNKGSKYRKYLECWDLLGDPIDISKNTLNWVERIKKDII